MNKEITKLDILIICLLLISIGAYLGISYDDNIWKNELNKFSDNHTNFALDHSGTYFTIDKHYFKNMYTTNLTIYLTNVTINKTK